MIRHCVHFTSVNVRSGPAISVASSSWWVASLWMNELTEYAV